MAGRIIKGGKGDRRGNRTTPVIGEPLEQRLLLSATLIKDLNTLPSSTILPAPLTRVGSLAYFAGNDGVHGSELWKTNGTSAGTVMVKDIRPGAAPSSPTSVTDVNGVAYFVADDGVHGMELWRSNGADGGTVLVKDINPGATGSTPSLLTAAGSVLYFFADDGAAGRELWRSDGTAGGTTMVADVRPGSAGQTPTGMAVTSDGKIYFTATDGTNAKGGLWRTDGTAAGTTFVKGVVNNLTGGVVNVYASGTRIYFRDMSNGIWASDGTAVGTVQIESAFGPSTFHDWVMDGSGGAYYVRDNSGDGIYRIEPGATSVRLVIDAETTQTYQDAGDLTLLNGYLYFVGSDSVYGREVYRLAPGKFVATVVKDAYPGPGTDSPDNLAVVNNSLYFTSGQSFSGYSLWRSDGTDVGTVKLGAIASKTARPPSDGIALGSTYLFVNDDGVNGPELWKSDGTLAGTALVKAIYPGTQPSTPQFWGPLGSAMLFTTTDAASGAVSLWRTDGTAVGTTTLYGAWASSYAPLNWRAVGSRMYFEAGTAATGRELWVTDGTAAGTRMVADINPASGSSSTPYGFTAAGAWTYFAATDGTHGLELWRTDGSAAGTTMVVDLRPGSIGALSTVSPPVAMNGLLYFAADNGTTGQELWRSDGTAGGTSVVLDAAPTGGLSTIRLGVVSNGTLFYGRGAQLWRSDGTAGGTILIKDFKAPTASEGVVDSLVQLGSWVYFAATDATGARGLWRTDGTAGGTTLVAAVAPKYLTVAGGSLYFFVSGASVGGAVLWHSDGTPAGTKPLAQVSTVVDSPYPSAPAVANGRVFFVANLPDTGAELWTSDGTAAGTGAVQDLNAGPGNGASSGTPAVMGGTVYASGDDGVSGLEPFRFPDSFPPVVTRGQFEFHGPHAVSLTFNEDVAASLVAADLVITNVATGSAVNPASIARAYDASTLTATFTFPGLAGGVLPDGNYRATFKAGSVTDAAGNAVSAAFAFDFFVLAGDANRDRAVDFNDLVALAQNYNTAGGKTYAQGDFNGDGNVDFNDLVILAQRYNTALPAVVAMPAPALAKVDAKKDRLAPVFSVTPVLKPVEGKSTATARRRR